MRLTGRTRTALVVLLVALGLLGVVVGRVVLSARAAYVRGQAAERRALAQADPKRRTDGLRAAIVEYRRAARWYAPGNAYVTRALDRLEAIGRLAEQSADAPTALEAWRAVRRAILGARSLYTPHGDRLARANARIAALSARLEGARAGADAIARSEAWHRAQLRRDTAPAVGWVVLALLGFFGWVGAAVGFLYRAVSPEDRLLGRPAILWGAGILVGLVGWLVGLTQA